MTNYINSITLEDGNTYPIGPLKLDNYANIVSHNIDLSSKFNNNVIIGSTSIDYDPLLTTNTISNNIIIGDPNVVLNNYSNNIVVGHSDNYIHVYTGSNNFVKLALNNVSISIDNSSLNIGPLQMSYKRISQQDAVILTGIVGPVDIYALGSCTLTGTDYNDGIYQVTGYTHAEVWYSYDGEVNKSYYSIPTLYPAMQYSYYDMTGGDRKSSPTVGFSVSDNSIYCAVGYDSFRATSLNLHVYIYSRPDLWRYTQ